MDTHWQQLDQLFAQALDVEGPEQAAFLERLRLEHPAFYPKVLELLAEDEKTTGVLDYNASTLISTLLTDLSDEPSVKPLETVGPYTVIRSLGQGGMGLIYLAERPLDGFTQTVAIKVLKPGLDSAAVIRRFRQERAVLATLEHPNIARLLDGGTTDDGRPYFVMEYIDGQPITDYCDAHHATIEERLSFFETVCETVQFAHQRLVVHRDLKPSNILVTPDGVVKLLDFGIAKVLGDGATNFSVIETMPAERLLTPAYASPEQLRGDVITTASDVYALGVLLYELLVGKRPFSQSYREALQNVVLDGNVMRPSKAVTSIIRASETETDSTWLLEARRTNYERLQKRLRGDLDVICLKALNTERERRYGTAGGLGADIRRHLAGMPVEAQPDSIRYRTRKFIRRHRTSVALTTLFGLILLTVTGIYTWQQARLLEDLVQEAEKTEAVQGFLIDMFAASNPYQTEGRDSMYVRDFLDEGARRISTSLLDQPLAQAKLMSTLGDVYIGLGLFDQADTLITKAQRIREHWLSAEDPAVNTGLLDLARLRLEQGRIDAADSLYGLTLQRINPEDHPRHVAYATHGLGQIAIERVNFDRAEALFKQALAIYTAHVPLDTSRYMSALESLGVLYSFQNRFEESGTYYREAVHWARQIHGDEHPVTASYLHNWADNTLTSGDLDEAERLFTEVLRIEEKTLGRDHIDITPTISNLGLIAHARLDYPKAESLYVEARAINERVFTSQSEGVGIQDLLLGNLHCEQGNFDTASEAFARASYGLSFSEIPDMFTALLRAFESECALQHDLFAEAATLAEQVQPLLEADEDFALLQPYAQSALGAVRSQQGRYAEAESLLVAAYDQLQQINYFPNRLPYVRQYLADLYNATGRATQAEAVLQSE